MVAVVQTPQVISKGELTRSGRYTGEVVYVYAYDVAYELTRSGRTFVIG